MDAFTFVRWAVKKMKLFVLYWRRIVFAKNHFKCPWYKKIKANLCGGFLADQSRDVIRQGAERLGWELDELLGKTLEAMRSCEDAVNEAMAE